MTNIVKERRSFPRSLSLTYFQRLIHTSNEQILSSICVHASESEGKYGRLSLLVTIVEKRLKEYRDNRDHPLRCFSRSVFFRIFFFVLSTSVMFPWLNVQSDTKRRARERERGREKAHPFRIIIDQSAVPRRQRLRHLFVLQQADVH